MTFKIFRILPVLLILVSITHAKDYTHDQKEFQKAVDIITRVANMSTDQRYRNLYEQFEYTQRQIAREMDTGASIDQAVKSVKGVTEDERIASVLEAYRVQGFDSAITPEYIKYKEIIEPIMKEHGLDPSVYGMVPWQESGFNPNVCVSATVDGKNETVKGMWQLTETTAKEMGLKVTSTGENAKGEGLDSDLAVDERYDVEKSTRAAAKYLNRIKSDLGEHGNNDALVLCSYHTGPTAVKKMIRDLGSDYWSWEISDRNIKAYGFGNRSFDYVPRILAAAELTRS